MYLEPFYKIINNVIREVDNTTNILFEPVTWNSGSSGFTEGPGGNEYNDKQMLSYHMYCPLITSSERRRILCMKEQKYYFNKRMDDIDRLGCGGFMTEFGAVDNGTYGIDILNYTTDLADTHFQSWTYWQYKYFDDLVACQECYNQSLYSESGQLELNKVRALSRTYAQKIAGKPINMFYNTTDSSFRLVYSINSSIKEPTVVYINEQLNYKNGYNLHVISKKNVTLVVNKLYKMGKLINIYSNKSNDDDIIEVYIIKK